MCKKKKKVTPPIVEASPVNVLDTFELKKPEPAYDESGERDYFTEYYNAYKNNYIDQYLEAYKKLKAEGRMPDFSPYGEVKTNTEVVESADEIDL